MVQPSTFLQKNPSNSEATDRLPKPVALQCQRWVLNNGLVVLVTENPGADIVAARFLIDAGGRRDPLSQAGLSRLVAEVLTKGTATATARDIAAQVESTGSSLGADSTLDYFLLTLKTVSADFAALLKLAADLIQTPTFPEAELELERKLTLQAIRSRLEQPMAIAFQQLQQALHPDHPYGQPSLGSPESVAGLTRSDLCQFHSQHFRPEQAVLSISGNISASHALALVNELFLHWRSVKPLSLKTSAHRFATQPVCRDTVRENQQSIIMLGYPAPAVQHPDCVALKLLHAYLCSGLSSRLFVELREKRGLAYEVSGFYPTRLDPSHFVVYIGTAAENTATAQALLQSEMNRLSEQPLSTIELAATKSKLLGQYSLGKQTNHQIAHTFGWYEFLRLGLDYDRRFPDLIRAVTAEEIHQAARRCFNRPFVSRVGPKLALSLAAQEQGVRDTSDLVNTPPAQT
jgi:zinc protease